MLVRIFSVDILLCSEQQDSSLDVRLQICQRFYLLSVVRFIPSFFVHLHFEASFVH